MTPVDAIAFLRRKSELIVGCTYDPDEQTSLRESWDQIFAAIALDEKIPALQKLDRALEKALKRHVFDWVFAALRETLVEEFGLSQLTNDEIELAAVPLPSPDDVTLMPSENRRAVTRRFLDPQGVEQALVDISAATLREFAQIFADYSGRPVRLPAALAERQILPELLPQMCEADAREVIATLRYHFKKLHVLAVNDKGGIVLKDTSARDAARAEANRPKQAAAVEIQQAAAAMSPEQFWQRVEIARQNSGDGMADTDKLEAALRRCSRAEILGFQLRLEECLAASYRLDLWAVAYLVKGGCSDDGFEYFRGWLIAQGRNYFEAALANPECAADRAEGREAECEEMLQVAWQAFARRSKKAMPYGLASRPPHATGTDWREEDLPKLFPRLAKKFAGSGS